MSSSSSFVVCPWNVKLSGRGTSNMGWVVKFSHEEMGEVPVGPRLAKGTRFPNEIGTHFEEKSDALRASVEWDKWYFAQPYLKTKRKAKYLA